MEDNSNTLTIFLLIDVSCFRIELLYEIMKLFLVTLADGAKCAIVGERTFANS